MNRAQARREQTTWLQSDLDEIAGVPDGEEVFIDMIGFAVPSFVDPRYDLIPPGNVGKTKRLGHHVPFAFRGPFRLNHLPSPTLWDGEVDEEGYCICTGKRKDGLPCRNQAANRTPFCSVHGGQLHPADRRISNLPDDIVPGPDKAPKLTRAQKVQCGLISVEDLGDDEIRGLFVWDDDGRKVTSRKLTERIHGEMTRELMTRMNTAFATKLPDMLDTIADIATDPIVEPADRLKAAFWWSERVIGKTPDVVIHGKTDKPYDQIAMQLETTSRDDYRRSIGDGNIIEGEVVELGDSGSDSVDVSNGSVVHDRSTDGRIATNGSRSARSRADAGDTDSRPVDASATNGATGDGDSATQERAMGIVARRSAARKVAEDRARAKARRFAARAMGANDMSDLPWVIDFRKVGGKSPHFYARIVAPEAQTPEILDRIAATSAFDQITQATA